MINNVPSLYDRFFQFGYVTRDAVSATAQFGRRFGPVEWFTIPGAPEFPHVKQVAFAFRSGVNIEIIEVNDAVPSLYKDSLPASPGDIRLHHLGYLVDDLASMVERLRREEFDVPVVIDGSDIAKLCYADARASLGHYLEYICLGPEGRAMFEHIGGFNGFP